MGNWYPVNFDVRIIIILLAAGFLAGMALKYIEKNEQRNDKYRFTSK